MLGDASAISLGTETARVFRGFGVLAARDGSVAFRAVGHLVADVTATDAQALLSQITR